MTDEAVEVGKRRRTAAEVERIVREFEASGLNRSQFCQRERLALITLNRYLKRVRGTPDAVHGELVPVELRAQMPEAGRGVSGGLAVVLASGRRIEVGIGFDGPTLQRLLQVLKAI